MDKHIAKTFPSRLSVAFAVLICATSAHAQQNTFQGYFTLPYEAHWSSAVLPAGDYSITIPSLNLPGILQPAKGGRRLLVSVGHAGDIEGNSAYLTVIDWNGVPKVISMNLPSLKLSLTYAPMSEAERKSHVVMRFPLSIGFRNDAD